MDWISYLSLSQNVTCKIEFDEIFRGEWILEWKRKIIISDFSDFSLRGFVMKFSIFLMLKSLFWDEFQK